VAFASARNPPSSSRRRYNSIELIQWQDLDLRVGIRGASCVK
jgi:hypothetical protein